MANDVTVVILAAGLGTRMKSRQAKVLHRAGGQTLIEHAVDTALAVARPERTFVVVGHQADKVEAAVRSRGVRFVHQIDQKGTGHAVMCGAAELSPIGGLLLVFYGDCPLIRAGMLEELIDKQRASDAAATMITTELVNPTGYGRVIRDARGNIQAIVEQKAGKPAQLAISEINPGIYCFSADLFWKHVNEIAPNNPAGEYYLTDMIEILVRAGHHIQPLRVPDAGDLLGINNRVELAAVDHIFRQRKVRQLMLDGVTIEKPETVIVDAGVRVGMDTIIGPFTQLLGSTVIGENCRVGAWCVIEDSELGDEVEIGPYTVIGTSKLEKAVHAGPFSRLRMGNHVGEGAHIGNFVELKKARLGKGVKANHLAYLGDTSIGAGTNIGAGTITCNYDGKRKHQTTIGERVFVGSNSTLVAPVEIEDEAYLAAGSVITSKVPSGALAFGRARQVIKEGWAKRRREEGQAETPTSRP